MPISIRVSVKVPELVLDSELVRHAIQQKMERKTKPDLLKEFRKTVEGWDNAPRFQSEVEHVVNLLTRVFTESERYAYVNNGTAPHIITPKGGGMLRFQTGYRAATSPKVIGSRKPQRFGPQIMTRGVRHPGIEPRLFDEVIALEYVDTFAQDIQDAINQAVKSASVSRP